ncbi:hypothetical protein [Kiloniella sp.]|uniref:hypothetical protein n=1 Tax=Kiloniella sp. TaxID=1938587 RepID=UPI003B010688
MLKKLTLLLATVLTILGLELASNTQNAWALDLSPEDCPVKIGAVISDDIDSQECTRYTSENNRSYYYILGWKSKVKSQVSNLVYQPIRGFQYWKTAPTVEKKDIHNWSSFKNIKLDTVTEVSCTGYTCYTFSLPNKNAECMWFAKKSRQGDKFLPGGGIANGILRGSLCKLGKKTPYNTEDAMIYLGALSAK